MIKYDEMFNFGPKLLLGANKSCKKGLNIVTGQKAQLFYQNTAMSKFIIFL